MGFQSLLRELLQL